MKGYIIEELYVEEAMLNTHTVIHFCNTLEEAKEKFKNIVSTLKEDVDNECVREEDAYNFVFDCVEQGWAGAVRVFEIAEDTKLVVNKF